MGQDSPFRHILQSLIDLLLKIELFHNVHRCGCVGQPMDQLKNFIFFLAHADSLSAQDNYLAG